MLRGCSSTNPLKRTYACAASEAAFPESSKQSERHKNCECVQCNADHELSSTMRCWLLRERCWGRAAGQPPWKITEFVKHIRYCYTHVRSAQSLAR